MANPNTTFFAIILSIILAVLIASFFPRKLLQSFPHPLVNFIMVLVFAVIMLAAAPSDNPVVQDIQNVYRHPPDSMLLQTIFLPPIVFADCLELNLDSYFHAKYQIMWLVGPALLFSAFAIGFFPLFLTTTTRFTFVESVAFGGLNADTDPVAVLMVLETLGGPEHLNAVIGGESLLNDGFSIIVTELLLQFQEGTVTTPGGAIGYFCQQLFLGPLVGLGLAILALLLIKIAEDRDISIVIAISIGFPFLAFAICTFYLESSGMLSVVTMGLFFNRFDQMLLNYHMQFIRGVWRSIEFITEHVFYSFAGLLIGTIFVEGNLTGEDWVNLLYFILWATFIRAVSVFASLPVLMKCGPRLTWRDATIMSYGGMRGSVSLLMSIFMRESEHVAPRIGELTLFYTAGLVLSYCINAATLRPLCKLLGVTFKAEKDPVFLQAKSDIYDQSRKIIDFMSNGDSSLVDSIFQADKPRHKQSFYENCPSWLERCCCCWFAREENQNVNTASTTGNQDALKKDDVEAQQGKKKKEEEDDLEAQHGKEEEDDLEAQHGKEKEDDLEAQQGKEKEDDLEAQQGKKEQEKEEEKGIQTTLKIIAIEEIREMAHRGARTIYENLLNAGLINSFSWQILNDGLSKEKSDKLFGWENVENAFPWILKHGSSKHTQNVTLAFAAWGFIICHARIRASLLRSFFEFDNPDFLKENRVPKQFECLVEESERNCFRPAEILNKFLKEDPEVIRTLKTRQGQTQMEDVNLDLLHSLLRKGIIDETRYNFLREEVNKISRIVHRNRDKIKLVPPQHIGYGGADAIINPNFAPFEIESDSGDEVEDSQAEDGEQSKDQYDEERYTTFEKLLKSSSRQSSSLRNQKGEEENDRRIPTKKRDEQRLTVISTPHTHDVQGSPPTTPHPHVIDDDLIMVRHSKPSRLHKMLDDIETLAVKRMRADEE